MYRPALSRLKPHQVISQSFASGATGSCKICRTCHAEAVLRCAVAAGRPVGTHSRLKDMQWWVKTVALTKVVNEKAADSTARLRIWMSSSRSLVRRRRPEWLSAWGASREIRDTARELQQAVHLWHLSKTASSAFASTLHVLPHSPLARIRLDPPIKRCLTCRWPGRLWQSRKNGGPCAGNA